MSSRESADSILPCSEAQLWMSLKVDGEEVPPEARTRLEEHLAACGPCESWLREETERSLRLREYLQSEPPDRQDFEEALLAAVQQAGWDCESLRFRRRGVGRVLGHSPWRNSLILIAAAALFLAVAGLGGAGWLFPPEEEVATSPTQLDMAPGPPILAPFTRGAGASVVPDSEGRPVEVRFARSLYRYRVLPASDRGGNRAALDSARAARGRGDGATANRAAGAKGIVYRGGLELELERVESRAVRLAGWPYE